MHDIFTDIKFQKHYKTNMNTFLSFWHIYFTPVCPVLYLRHSLCYKNYCITNISSGQKCFKTLYLAFITQ